MPTGVTIGIAVVSLLRSQQCYKHLPCVSGLYVSSSDVSLLQCPLSPLRYSMTLLPAEHCTNPFSLESFPESAVQVFQHFHFQPSSVPRSYGQLLYEDTLSNTSPVVQLSDVCPDSLMVFSDRDVVTHSLQHPWEELCTQYTLNKLNCD